MPVLKHKPTKIKTHPHFVQYVNNKPVAANPHPGQDKIYNYHTQSFVPAHTVKQVSQHSETQASYTGDYLMQFSEEELAAMPASVKAKLDQEVAAQKQKREEAEAKAAQFEEEKRQQANTTARNNAIAAVKATPLPPAMKKELTTALETSQFAEGAEAPLYTSQQVAELFTKFIPKHLQFCEEDTTTSDPPKGKRQIGSDSKGNPIFEGEMGEQYFESGELAPGHVTVERANEIINSSPVMAAQRRNSRKQSVGEEVTSLNANKSW